jgi:hypothetical protein
MSHPAPPVSIHEFAERLPDVTVACRDPSGPLARTRIARKESSVPDLHTLMSGLAFPESPRWHDGRFWFSDWGAQEVIAVDLDGTSEVIVRVPSFPMCIDWLTDGRLLIVAASEGRL